MLGHSEGNHALLANHRRISFRSRRIYFRGARAHSRDAAWLLIPTRLGRMLSGGTAPLSEELRTWVARYLLCTRTIRSRSGATAAFKYLAKNSSTRDRDNRLVSRARSNAPPSGGDSRRRSGLPAQVCIGETPMIGSATMTWQEFDWLPTSSRIPADAGFEACSSAVRNRNGFCTGSQMSLSQDLQMISSFALGSLPKPKFVT